MLLLSYRSDRLRTSIILRVPYSYVTIQLLVDQYSTVVVLVNRVSTIKYTLLHQTNGTTAVGLQVDVTTVLLY